MGKGVMLLDSGEGEWYHWRMSRSHLGILITMELGLEKYPKPKSQAGQTTSCGMAVMWINTHFYGNLELNLPDAFLYGSGNGKRLFLGHMGQWAASQNGNMWGH